MAFDHPSLLLVARPFLMVAQIADEEMQNAGARCKEKLETNAHALSCSLEFTRQRMSGSLNSYKYCKLSSQKIGVSLVTFRITKDY